MRGDADLELTGVATLAAAGPGDISFLTNPKYRRQALASAAGALLVGPGSVDFDRPLLVADDPYFALTTLLLVFYPEPPPPPAGVHPTAVVDAGATVAPSAHVGAYAVVGAGSEIGAEAVLHSHTVVGKGCRIGARTVIHPHVTLYDDTLVGSRCIVHSGTVLGSDGFGYATHEGEHHKLRQAGRVVVEDDVEIGANCTIDRAMLEQTTIKAGTKLDDLVHVGHNAEVGEASLLVAQVGVGGSAKLGRGVVIGGQSGVAGHLTLGDGVMVGSKSAVFRSVEAGRMVAGIPATDMAAWRRQQALVRRLEDMRRRLRALEEKAGE